MLQDMVGGIKVEVGRRAYAMEKGKVGVWGSVRWGVKGRVGRGVG